MKKITHDVAELVEIIGDLNVVGAVDGLIFALVRSDGKAPLFGRVCNDGAGYELLGAGYMAVYGLEQKLCRAAEDFAPPDSRDPEEM
jgi:hypothetical protein